MIDTIGNLIFTCQFSKFWSLEDNRRLWFPCNCVHRKYVTDVYERGLWPPFSASPSLCVACVGSHFFPGNLAIWVSVICFTVRQVVTSFSKHPKNCFAPVFSCGGGQSWLLPLQLEVTPGGKGLSGMPEKESRLVFTQGKSPTCYAVSPALFCPSPAGYFPKEMKSWMGYQKSNRVGKMCGWWLLSSRELGQSDQESFCQLECSVEYGICTCSVLLSPWGHTQWYSELCAQDSPLAGSVFRGHMSYQICTRGRAATAACRESAFPPPRVSSP